MRNLAEDEYYEVALDYWYKETNPVLNLYAKQTYIVVPQTLYDVPNCSVFNWQVTLMRCTGRESNGQSIGEPISYSSLYWYFWWQYPAGVEHSDATLGDEPFVMLDIFYPVREEFVASCKT